MMAVTDLPALRRGRAALYRAGAACLTRARGVALAPRAPLVIATALAAVLGWQLGALIWQLVPGPGAEGVPAAAAMSAAETSRSPGSGGGAGRGVAGRLFGERAGEAGQEAAPQRPERAPETRLNLSLRGVFAVGDGAGFAYIVTQGGDESVYSRGDALPGNARLERVYGDRVLLDRDGTLETLWLDRADVASRESPRRERGASRERGGSVPEGFDRQRAGETARALRARLREDPSQLMQMVQFQPYEDDGELRGFRVQPRGDVNERLLRGLGLTREDVVTSINDIPLNDRGRLGEVIETLDSANEARVRFLRDGDPHRVRIPLAGGG